jgi:hypothetical protein
MLGLAYFTLGRSDKAANACRDWMADEPDNPMPHHFLAAGTGEGVPDRATSPTNFARPSLRRAWKA